MIELMLVPVFFPVVLGFMKPVFSAAYHMPHRRGLLSKAIEYRWAVMNSDKTRNCFITAGGRRGAQSVTVLAVTGKPFR